MTAQHAPSWRDPHRSLAAIGIALAGSISVSFAENAPRHVPEHEVPVPETVSPAMQAVIARSLSPIWNAHPKSAEEWKTLVAKVAADTVATLPAMRERRGVKVEPATIAGVKAFIVTPEKIAEANRDRLLFHLHGGGYLLAPGEAGTREAILAAG